MTGWEVKDGERCTVHSTYTIVCMKGTLGLLLFVLNIIIGYAWKTSYPIKSLGCKGSFNKQVPCNNNLHQNFFSIPHSRLHCHQTPPNEAIDTDIDKPIVSSNVNAVKTSSKKSFKAALAKAGQSGLLAYGSLNCLYYTTATTIVWILTGRSQSAITTGSKLSNAIARVSKVCVTVWIGSQTTKPLRAAGALFLAPSLDKVLDFVHNRFALKSRQQAFNIIFCSLLGTFIGFYSLLVLSYLIIP
jgi:hypothetical protein